MGFRTRLFYGMTVLAGLVLATAIVAAVQIGQIQEATSETLDTIETLLVTCLQAPTNPEDCTVEAVTERLLEIRKDEERVATNAGTQIAILVIVSLLGLTLTYSSLNRRVFLRLSLMREQFAENAEDGWRRRLPVHGDDDVTAIARAFNGRLDHAEEEVAREKSRVESMRRLVLALLETDGRPCAVIDEDGRVLVLQGLSDSQEMDLYTAGKDLGAQLGSASPVRLHGRESGGSYLPEPLTFHGNPSGLWILRPE